MLTTEIYARTLPDLFSRFDDFIDQKHWLERVKLINAAIKGNPLLQEYLTTENEIVFQLARLSGVARVNGDRVPLSAVNDWGIHQAARFMGQVLSFIDDLPHLEVTRFRQRIYGAFKNPDDMRGLHLEMLVATRFIRLGKKVAWPEIVGGGTFDLLIEDIGADGLEVECKSISNDKGRKIHHQEAFEFFNLMRPILKPVLRGLTGGVCTVLTLPDRMPAAYKDRAKLAKDWCAAILNRQGGVLHAGASVTVGDFDISVISENLKSGKIPDRGVIEGVARVRNQKSVVLSLRDDGAIILVLQSGLSDKLIEATFDTIGRAVRSQLSGTRAGLLMVNFPDISGQKLASIFQEDQITSHSPSELRIHMDRFLASQGREHLIGISFLSGDSTRSQEGERMSTGGAAYHFSMMTSPHWSAEFDSLFV